VLPNLRVSKKTSYNLQFFLKASALTLVFLVVPHEHSAVCFAAIMLLMMWDWPIPFVSIDT
jgi:hypothetical protein